LDHDVLGVFEQKLLQLQPVALLPRQAVDWKATGTYWHQAGKAGAAKDDTSGAASSLELLCASRKFLAPPQPHPTEMPMRPL